MTVSNNYAPVVTAANGVTTVFSASWNALAAANVVVQLLNTTTGVYTPVTQGLASNQYQVTTLTPTSLVITFNTAPASGNNVVLSRSTAQTQTIPYTTSRGFQGSVEEGSFDALTNMVQELSDMVQNSLQVSIGDTTESLILPIATLRAGRVLAFDGSGNVIVSDQTLATIEAGSTAAAASAAAAAASASAASASQTAAGGSATAAAASATAAAAAAAGITYYSGSTSGSSATAFKISTGQSLTTLTAGMRFRGIFSVTNSSTAPTLQVDTAPATTIYKDAGGALTSLTPNDIPSFTDAEFMVIDGTHIQIINPLNEFKNTATGGQASAQVANMTAVQASMTGGFVNKFRNPSFDIWQRGTSLSVVSGTPAYTADGWIVSTTGATATVAQTNIFDFGAYSSLKITGNTSMTDTSIKQRIESVVAAQLFANGSNGADPNVTVQFIVENNTGASITPTLTVKHAGSQDNWSSPVTDVNAVSLQSVANGAASLVAYTFAPSGNTVFGLEVTLDFGAALNANTKNIQIALADIRPTPGVPVGINSNPPQPEFRPIPIELAYCQRYFLSQTLTFNQFWLLGQAYTTGNGFMIHPFPVRMFAAPTGLTVTGATNAALTSSTTLKEAISSIIFSSSTVDVGVSNAASAAGLAAGNATMYYGNSSGNTTVFQWTGAEL